MTYSKCINELERIKEVLKHSGHLDNDREEAINWAIVCVATSKKETKYIRRLEWGDMPTTP